MEYINSLKVTIYCSWWPERCSHVCSFKTDKLLEHNLLGQIDVQQSMEDELKAIIQQYMIRMNNDELVVK